MKTTKRHRRKCVRMHDNNLPTNTILKVCTTQYQLAVCVCVYVCANMIPLFSYLIKQIGFTLKVGTFEKMFKLYSTWIKHIKADVI